VHAFGISVNRWEPTNGIRASETGLVDSVQVVYNIFDQAPEDDLFPYCECQNIAVIARVPFDAGSLTGTLTRDWRWPDGDWRNSYFTPKTLADTLDRVERLLLPAGMDLPEFALRFILEHPAVSTTIPGMRRPHHVDATPRRQRRRSPAAEDSRGRARASVEPNDRDRIGQVAWDGDRLV
jgi:aryl-alcohol dehydrogenase-like predicted oxidoreductase